MPTLMPSQLKASTAIATRTETLLRLVFRQRGGQTYLADQYVQAPYRVLRPFALEDGTAVLQLGIVGPGVMGADAYRLEVDVEEGAAVVLLGTSATKVHAMASGVSATQKVRLGVAAGARLEYYPGLTIPCADADFSQTLNASVHPDGKLGLLETWATGRVAHDEELAFRRLSTRTRVDVGKQPSYLDALELVPGSGRPSGMGVMEGARYAAAGYWYWANAANHPAIDDDGLLRVSGKPATGDLYVRALSRTGIALRHALRSLLADQRRSWGLQPLVLDRFTAAL